MIPVIDSYFAGRFKKNLNAILESVDDKDREHYLLGEILQGYGEDAAKKFENAYGIKNGTANQEVSVYLAYPDSTQQTNACYVITRGSSEESSELGGLGNSMSDGNELGRTDSYYNMSSDEPAVIQHDDDGYFMETQYPILEIRSIKETDRSMIDFDSFEKGSNRVPLISIFDPSFVGKMFHVTYEKQDTGSHKDMGNYMVGYSAQESIVISSLSNNADTARELDSVLKFILINMREGGKESNYFQLPHIKSEPLSLVNLKEDGDSPIYVIDTTVTYTTNYSVSKDSATRINNIIYHLKTDGEV